jgi:hypothetical protein
MLPQIIISRIHGQAVQPRLKNFGGTELIEREIQPQEHLLADILHVFRPGYETRNRPKGSFPIYQHDFIKRGGVASLRALDYLKID